MEGKEVFGSKLIVPVQIFKMKMYQGFQIIAVAIDKAIFFRERRCIVDFVAFTVAFQKCERDGLLKMFWA